MTEYGWYEVVPADVPVTQGDIIESCPVLLFEKAPEVPNPPNDEALIAALQDAAGVDFQRVIVMTQACDIEQGNIRDVILCPVYYLQAWRQQWEARRKELGKPANAKAWENHLESVKKGQIWNLTMLKSRDADETTGVAAVPVQIVDFHEVFSLPLAFVEGFVRIDPRPRLRLCPPYREHLSQAFARYFMRVGLPQDIELP